MSRLPPLPDDLPWDAQQALVLLDGALIDDLPTRLKQVSPTANALALYDQPPFSALRDVSPLLIAVPAANDPVARFFMQQADDECGVLLFSPQPPYSVAEHLRKLLTVETPMGASALLRLADAAVLRALLAGGTPALFGPLSCVVSADSVGAAWHCQRPAAAHGPELEVPYRLSAEQEAALDAVDRRRVLLELDGHLRQHFPGFHADENLLQRWPMLEQIANQASELNLGGQAELRFYANLIAWLGDTSLEQHPTIQHLLCSPSLQPPGERVALAAELAHQWASERGHS